MIIQPKKELLEAILGYQAGDGGAFDAIYYGSAPYITKCVLNVLNRTAPGASEDLQQDIIQDTYLTIAEKLHTLQRPEAFFQWAGQIATRHAQRTWNKEVHRQEMEQSDGELDFEIMDEDFIPEDILQNKELQLRIRKMLEELPTNQYLCIVEYFYNGLKETEVAAKLGMPVNTVKTNLSRAKKKLKTMLASEEQGSVKLRSMGWLLLMLLLLEAQTLVLDPEKAAKLLGRIRSAMGAAAGGSAGAAGAAASAAANGSAAGGFLASLWGKIVVGVAAAAVLIGGTVAGNGLLRSLVDREAHKPGQTLPIIDYDPMDSETVEESWHGLTLVVSSELGEQWDEEYTYRLEDSFTGETVTSGSGVGEIEIETKPGQYTLIIDSPRHRTLREQITLQNREYSRLYLQLITDGSWLGHVDCARISDWLQYLDLPVGIQEVPSLFVNDCSAENTGILLGTLENALPCETRQPNILIYYPENEAYVLAEGREFAQRYIRELFGYLPEGGIPEQLLQLPETEEQIDYISEVRCFEKLDADRIRVWVDVVRQVYLVQGDTLYATEKTVSYNIVATLRYSKDCTMNWELETAVCYVPDQELPPVEQGALLEASPTDDAAYAQLTSQAVDAREWEENGPVILTEEQRQRMENVLLCTAYADSGIISRMTLASYGGLLADVQPERNPFLKATKPAQSNWDKCEVLLLLAWLREPGLQVKQESGYRCGDSGSLSYDSAGAQELMAGLFGAFDISELDGNVILQGYDTEISGGRLYQPKTNVYQSRYGDGYGTLTLDKLENLGEGKIRICATYRADVTLSCVYEAVKNPDSYIGYTLTGVSYTFAE